MSIIIELLNHQYFMFDLSKTQKISTPTIINIILRAIIALLLAIIAYNTSYLKGILHELIRSDQEKQFVVNVNNSAPNTATSGEATIPTTNLKETKTPSPTASPMAKAKAPPESKKQENSKAAVSAESNQNPTTHKVEMLNNSPEGAMVFSPPYIHIKAGDSIEFSPASYGHNVQTPEDILGNDEAIPKKAKTFKGAMNEKLIVKFTEPGIYLYICNYHYIVGHVGVIQVGNDSHNIDTVRKAGTELKGKIFSHPERVDKYLDMVKIF